MFEKNTVNMTSRFASTYISYNAYIHYNYQVSNLMVNNNGRITLLEGVQGVPEVIRKHLFPYVFSIVNCLLPQIQAEVGLA